MNATATDHHDGPALVTGGAGFIGSNLVQALRAGGRRVAVLDTVVHGRTDRVPDDVVIHRVDVRDAAAVERVVADLRPATIFHLAAQVDVRIAVDRPAEDAEVNILGTIAVLEAARAHGARVVFASSGGAAYGERAGMPLPTPEDHRPEPQSPYGLSKVCGEEYCALYARLHGVRAMVLRLSNVYGPGQDHLGEAGVVAIFCGCAASGSAPTVYGDGLQTRDYVYVGDVVDAFLAAETAPAGTLVNIGTGVESTVLDLLEGLGLGGRAHHEPERAGEVRRSVLDATAAGSVLGWRPKVALAEGLRLTRAALDPGSAAP